MTSKSTKQRILDTALELFNDFGTRNVSTNRIAAAMGMSKGNLNYHYSTKSEIILDLLSQIKNEILGRWIGDYLNPTMDHMRFMFMRQMHLSWEYRFFYRELTDLLRDNPLLGKRYNDLRHQRQASLERFLIEMAGPENLNRPSDHAALRRVIVSSWVLSENWINYLESLGIEVNEDNLNEGYEVLLTNMKPYLDMVPVAVPGEQAPRGPQRPA